MLWPTIDALSAMAPKTKALFDLLFPSTVRRDS